MIAMDTEDAWKVFVSAIKAGNLLTAARDTSFMERYCQITLLFAMMATLDQPAMKSPASLIALIMVNALTVCAFVKKNGLESTVVQRAAQITVIIMESV